eukprot:3993180-Pyramimonas_sp.AAC.1
MDRLAGGDRSERHLEQLQEQVPWRRQAHGLRHLQLCQTERPPHVLLRVEGDASLCLGVGHPLHREACHSAWGDDGEDVCQHSVRHCDIQPMERSQRGRQ